jgi:hypothetical protein
MTTNSAALKPTTTTAATMPPASPSQDTDTDTDRAWRIIGMPCFLPSSSAAIAAATRGRSHLERRRRHPPARGATAGTTTRPQRPERRSCERSLAVARRQQLMNDRRPRTIEALMGTAGDCCCCWRRYERWLLQRLRGCGAGRLYQTANGAELVPPKDKRRLRMPIQLRHSTTSQT